MLGKQLQTAAAGSGAAAGLGVEDVFSTYLYTGTGSSQTITNGIDLAGEGGLVWAKPRGTGSHQLHDTARGINYSVYSDGTSGQDLRTDFTSVNADGFTLTSSANINISSVNYASWTFRKAPGFFDVVTYTGTGANTGSRTISHNLGSVPGMIIIKRTSGAEDWMVYHRSLGVSGGIKLNIPYAAWTGATDWANTAPTATEFTIRDNDIATNGAGETYVAYLFAHDAQIFGESGNESVIKCGSYTGNGVSATGDGNFQNLGWEPQWLLIKNTSRSVDPHTGWHIFDNMRGVAYGNTSTAPPGEDKFLSANKTSGESADALVNFSATGFSLTGAGYNVNYLNDNYIYIAIRRGPMKTPTDATKVFAVNARSGNQTYYDVTGIGFAPDAVWCKHRSGTDGGEHLWFDKLRGRNQKLSSNSTAAESNYNPDYLTAFGNDGYSLGSGYYINYNGNTYVDWIFRRAPGFFDIVVWSGDGTSNRAINHNLGVTPDLYILKRRTNLDSWLVTTPTLAPNAQGFYLNTTNSKLAGISGLTGTSAPTDTHFYVSSNDFVNGVGDDYIAYLFATLPGISKVGSYTGTGTTLNVDCGFSAGARFVLIKRTDSTGDWYVWDTARGIVSSSDPYLLLNSTAAEVTGTDYIDPYSAGFTVTSTAPASLNASGGNYIFLAIA